MALYYAVTDLGTLPGGASSNGYAISDSGQVVGSSQVTGGHSHAFLWRVTGGMQDLGTLPGGNDSSAAGISACGAVAGQYRNVKQKFVARTAGFAVRVSFDTFLSPRLSNRAIT